MHVAGCLSYYISKIQTLSFRFPPLPRKKMTSDEHSDRMQTLETRILSLYKEPLILENFLSSWTPCIPSTPLPSGVLAVKSHLEHLDLLSKSRIYHVSSDYYDWSYEKRVLSLNAPTTSHLCKSIFFENTRYQQGPFSSSLDPKNSQFYLVIVQYVDKISTQKLLNFVRELGGNVIPRKRYNFRLASQEKSEELTGFIRNGVCPFGLQTQIPIIVTKNVASLEPAVLYLGAGHPDYKLALPVKEFLKSTSTFVADLE